MKAFVMLRFLKRLMLLASLIKLALVWSVSFVFAGQLGMTSISTWTSWEPSDCYEPTAPYFSCYDEYSCESAVDEYNDYVSEVRSYLACIQNEAEADLRNVTRAIQEGVSEAASDKSSDVDDAKYMLENALESGGYSLR
ncbi:hypothetical protein PsAD13_04159 [Pseudovibrio sp. Ad13]|uniref:hypothetical protein n=1 Tax=Pseudovibrio sp. Ad13 TaxID=989396 RepID=UPI0007B1E264|nr:hypothetical protein [Pseudovibrio sp. Ad13]KZK81211.1 hypothetical protein PsAD13_04159 [Pseudovibrio sp. Ad13]